MEKIPDLPVNEEETDDLDESKPRRYKLPEVDDCVVTVLTLLLSLLSM